MLQNKNLNKEADDLNKILHYSVIDNVIYGEINGYLFSIYVTSSTKATLFIEIDNIPSEERVSNASIKYNKKLYLKTLAQSYACYTYLNYDLSNPNLRDELNDELNQITLLLKETSTMQKNKCMFCGKKCDTNHVVRGFNIYIHDDCWKQQRLEEKERMKKWDKMKKRYPLGILLAFIFSLIGLVPSLLLAGLAKIELGALYILAPILGFFGYRLAHTIIGAPQKFAISITSGVSGIIMYILTCLWISKISTPAITFVDALNANLGFFMQIVLFLVLSTLLVNLFVEKLKVFKREEEEFYSSCK